MTKKTPTAAKLGERLRRDRKPPTAQATNSAAELASPATPSPGGKVGSIVALLRRPKGANITELVDATGWRAHSVRGAIAGAIKKKLGLQVLSTKSEAGRVYRIQASDDAV